MPPLVEYTKIGLKNCYMPERQSWSFIYHLDGRDNPNESLPSKDAFYSLNVILGFAKLGRKAWENDYDLPALLQKNARDLFETGAPTYAMGMALWAAAELDVPLEESTGKKIRDFIRNRSNWRNFRAQDAGMLLTGMAEEKARGYHGFDQDSHDLYRFIINRYRSKSGLFFDQTYGLRKNFGSFATQTYLTTACYHYGTRFKNEEALAIADESTQKLISLQGSNGGWPWFYFVPRGMVVDHYEVYSVHQHGMAPLFLTFAEEREVPGATQAITKGFEWLLGNNQLQQNMFVPELGMFYRSIIRHAELADRRHRVTRALGNALTGTSDTLAPGKDLTLRRECRSYELGWILYSFGNRTDMPRITHNGNFVEALKLQEAA